MSGSEPRDLSVTPYDTAQQQTSLFAEMKPQLKESGAVLSVMAVLKRVLNWDLNLGLTWGIR